MGIIITRKGTDAKRLQPSGFQNEDYLQNYIANNPESLPLDEIGEDVQLMIIAREFSTSSGPIDVLAIDKQGWPYVLETKLYKNPDKRTVVAQILDYGAALWKGYGEPDQFIAELDELMGDEQVGGLRQRMQSFFGITGEECTQAIEALKTHIEEGAMRFVVLMDHLDPRLRDLILFLNQNSRFSIYAVEMEFYRHDDLEIVIPRLFGAEVRKEASLASSTVGRRRWDERSFFDELARRADPAAVDAIRRVFMASKPLADDISFGTGVRVGSFSPKFNRAGPKSFFTLRTDCRLVLNFGWLTPAYQADPVICRRFRDAVERLELGELPGEDEPQHVYLLPDAWMPKVDGFIHAMSEVFGTAQSALG